MMLEQNFVLPWAGRELKVTLGKMAWQTNGSALVSYGGTQVLAAVVMGPERAGVDFFPLMVEFEEKMYAAGKIKGSRFIKRETRPSDEAVLSARLVDRTVRPLFSQKIRRDVQLVLTVLSVDDESPSDVPSLVAGALALHISDIPWAGPVAGVRVAKLDGSWIVNPTNDQREKSQAELIVAGSGETTIMIECGANEVNEADTLAAIDLAQTNLGPVVKWMNEIRTKAGKPKLDLLSLKTETEKELYRNVEEMKEKIEALIEKSVNQYLLDSAKGTKQLRKESIKTMQTEIKAALLGEGLNEEVLNLALADFKMMVELYVSKAILEQGLRVDGRKLDEIRPLKLEVGTLERTHGSALFSRGETQVLSVVTLGAPGDEQTLDGMEEDGTKRYMHHYNFPGYAVGEAKPFRGPSRRDIGHGALAEKAVALMLPPKDQFPYTVRVVSETLTSNGSSSMASVCGSTLSLLDAGVPIRRPVAGIAMGIATNESGKFRVFTDLQDLEDSEGGMDFKIAGTREGITSIQMDTKTNGLTREMIKTTLDMARKARFEILDAIAAVIPTHRKELSPYAPRIEVIKINPEKIGDVIGPGGKIIREITEKSGATIDIEQDGTVFISAKSPESMKIASDWVRNLTREVMAGEVFENAKVMRLMDFGAFCEVLPGQEGLVHVSEISYARTNLPSDVLQVGDIVKVKVLEIDSMGRMNLSMKALLPKPEGYIEQPRAPRREGPPRGGRGGGFRR
ncbi:MAG: polyribonucleotide nucleotidyltransferase [Parcubacteria group bacterium Gr01-1014_18]|nr:MAG: polyribonucleotide nucleotidyltransferase [Parcubacteria group bacterium Greene0416_36]TSC81332.1 MAG: polyribonucleotide nucleotidyltransferase [Parcubacteria group bacterium Gr01-1014_18]TSC99482.1 MAG: polyribonucleotide nucleotidyltransferase [Parcubacteria group bacterium Greene1014_20]TSD07599.1 MAG: polyribonucleotide nucleotidyltransferase [Parcubacteria group bacterium Greene0714_2]